jgi:hypothetical protein
MTIAFSTLAVVSAVLFRKGKWKAGVLQTKRKRPRGAHAREQSIAESRFTLGGTMATTRKSASKPSGKKYGEAASKKKSSK